MKGDRQGIRSTSEWATKVKELKARLKKEYVPQDQIKKEHDIFIKIVDLKETLYTDQTGKFPYISSRGNRYVMVGIHVDGNYIFMEAMKNRTEAQMIEAYQQMFKRIERAGLSVKKHILDNELSENYKQFSTTIALTKKSRLRIIPET